MTRFVRSAKDPQKIQHCYMHCFTAISFFAAYPFMSARSKVIKEIETMNCTELNLDQMSMINGGSTATIAAHIIGAIATPLATAVGGPVCGIATAAIMAAVNAAAEYSDQ